jgi:hypothetical protein
VELVRERLELAGCRPRGGDEKFASLCPAHPDTAPSLSVREGDDGRALIHCFSGCSVEEVVHALGLELGDLFEPRRELPPPQPRRRRELTGIDALLEALRRRDTDYRSTRDPDTWVTTCPKCGAFPLILHREPDGDVRVGCANGCTRFEFASALGVELTRGPAIDAHLEEPDRPLPAALELFVATVERTLGREAVIPDRERGVAYMRCRCTPAEGWWPVLVEARAGGVFASCARCGATP